MVILILLLGGLVWFAATAGCAGESLPEPTAVPTPDIPTPTAPASASIPTSPAPTSTAPAPTYPAPSATPVIQPVAVATPASPVAAAPGLADRFPVPPEQDYYRLAGELMPEAGDVERAAKSSAPALRVGHRKTLRLVDLNALRHYESDFVLHLVTPHAYWFFEDGTEVDEAALKQSADEFENSIYPKVTSAFGSEWIPGIDGDPHLYVINANLSLVGGYFSYADEYPVEIRPISNEIEAIYINIRYLSPGTSLYSEVLAHELQHAIHWNADASEETWVNEGLSELAVSMAGFPHASTYEFSNAGPTSLIHWPPEFAGEPANYGASSLFMHYLTAHYAERSGLRPLLSQPADGIEGIDAYLEEHGFEDRFHDVFRNWAVANLLDENSGLYGYPKIRVSFPVYRNLKSGNELKSTIPQYANEYVRLEQLSVPSVLSFEGNAAVPLLPTDAGDGCWWSNKGDTIDSTLRASLDLRVVEAPSLDYQVWYSIEEDWDYAYVEVSEDGGSSWTILETPLTSSDDPLDVSFGPGYTGRSGGWQTESVSLERWAGMEILVRFQYITDPAIHDHGLCIRSLKVSAGSGEQALEAEWTPDGFVWTDNRVQQSFIVQVIYEGEGNHTHIVTQMELDGNNRGSITITPADGVRRIIAVAQSVAPSTRMSANYTMRLEPAQ